VCPFPWPPMRIPSNAAACGHEAGTAAQRLRQPAQPYVQCPWVERLAALIDEDVGGLDPVRLLLPVQELETVHLIALQVVNTIGSTLEPADDDGAQRLLAGTRRSMHV
jgi:hypothetical protein